jgi:hypothetical protein
MNLTILELHDVLSNVMIEFGVPKKGTALEGSRTKKNE